MKIIEPQVELWQQSDNPISHVAKCARVCYGNTVSKGEEADKRLCESLKKSGHLSMFRHESVYAIIPYSKNVGQGFKKFQGSPYISWIIAGDSIYLSTNKNWMIDNRLSDITDDIYDNRVSAEEFAQTETGHSMMRYTFHITTQISTSRELNRVSPNAIAERSTRYTDESNGAICRPHWMSKTLAAEFNEGYGISPFSAMTPSEDAYIDANLKAFAAYKELINSGVKRQDARGVLPLDTATEVIYTYSVNEWKHIIELRSAKNAHPNAQVIANMIKDKLNELNYDIQ